MKKYIQTTRIDQHGRVVLPAEVRRFLGYDAGTKFEVDYTVAGSITLTPTVALYECGECGSMVHVDRLKKGHNGKQTKV